MGIPRSRGLDPRTGKYKTKSLRSNGIYPEVKKALREFADEIEHDRVQGKTPCIFEENRERSLERCAWEKRPPRRRRSTRGGG